jgi:hypothetical protein
MRTTITLEDDVAVRLEREMKKRGTSFKGVVNDVLRAGLDTLEAPRRDRKIFRTEPLDLGGSLIGSLDNIEEVLCRVEGEDHK